MSAVDYFIISCLIITINPSCSGNFLVVSSTASTTDMITSIQMNDHSLDALSSRQTTAASTSGQSGLSCICPADYPPVCPARFFFYIS